MARMVQLRRERAWSCWQISFGGSKVLPLTGERQAAATTGGKESRWEIHQQGGNGTLTFGKFRAVNLPCQEQIRPLASTGSFGKTGPIAPKRFVGFFGAAGFRGLADIVTVIQAGQFD